MSTVQAPAHTASRITTVLSVASRTVLKMLRSPQVLGIAIGQSIVFLLMFRYVLGGAIGVPGVSYVEFLVPGFVVSGLLFTAGGTAVAVSEEVTAGLYDRLRSLPISDSAVLAGRALADAGLMVIVAVVTLGVGFVVGFEASASVGDWLLALALLGVFALAFSFAFVWLGLISGSAQAAQGLGLLAVPFSFVSSAFVPIDTMPDVLEAFAEWQPLTFMVNSWRGLLLGDGFAATFDHSLEYYVIGSLIWTVVIVAAVAPFAIRSYRKG